MFYTPGDLILGKFGQNLLSKFAENQVSRYIKHFEGFFLIVYALRLVLKVRAKGRL